MGLLVLVGGGVALLPRGVRNNNPGNIRKNPNFVWHGEKGVDEKGFVIFDTPENGYRAMARTLTTYYNKRGLKSIAQIISRYAPPSENPTSEYIKTVSTKINYPAFQEMQEDKFFAMLPRIIHAMSEVEVGKDHYKLSQAQQGVMSA